MTKGHRKKVRVARLHCISPWQAGWEKYHPTKYRSNIIWRIAKKESTVLIGIAGTIPLSHINHFSKWRSKIGFIGQYPKSRIIRLFRKGIAVSIREIDNTGRHNVFFSIYSNPGLKSVPPPPFALSLKS